MKLPRVQFTVRRLMGVVALAAMAAGGVLSLQRSSEAAHRTQCRSNLAQVALGLIQYADVYDSFPAGTVANDRLRPEKRLSWLVAVWSFMEQWLWLLDWSAPWDADSNRVTRGRGVEEEPRAIGRLGTLTCPAASGSAKEHMPGWTWYVGIAGVGTDAPGLPNGHPRAGVFGYDRQTAPRDNKDGASHTLLLAETGVGNGPWTAGGPPTVRGLDPARKPYVGPRRQFGGTHRGGLQVVLADGSVRFLNETINPDVFEALSTVSGGEALPAGWNR